MKQITNKNNILQDISTEKAQQFDEVVRLILQTKKQVLHLANRALIELYWQIGGFISQKLAHSVWGDSVVAQLAVYIEKNHPNIKGFSDKNLWRMKQFYELYAGCEKLSPLVRELSWTNNLIIMNRSKSEEERTFYLDKCITERLSKRELERQINAALYERSLKEPHVSSVMQEIAPSSAEIFRDSYVFEFLGVNQQDNENKIKNALLSKMKDFILELGKDFLFIDQEYRLQVGNSDFRIDLLFYHRQLQCLVAFELKTEQFKPEHLGQLNFYLEALDRDVKNDKENPSIGVLLCKDKDDEVVEYALNRSLSPTMVAEYQLCLPDKKLLQEKWHEITDN